MSYIALYRKYRPNNFGEMVGQENIVSILKNQIIKNKISHAYIFSGTRGTGKTSAAKVFARAINCLNLKDGEPCNECESCLSILNNETTDIVEMDAASNNSVDNIRQIRQEVVYATSSSKYRVYIIDEVHMLTTSAFNALLKTLEEPPEKVVFILATTEQHKIPVTILSRCLRFEFNRISEKDITERLKLVLGKENVSYEDEALEYISKLADGAMRDGLSILDRCISEEQEKLTLKIVENIIGSIDKNIINNIVDNILTHNTKDLVENLDLVIKKGKDLRQLIYQLLEKFLDLLVKNSTKNNEKYNLNDIINIIDELSKMDNEIKYSIKPNIIVKAILIRIANGNVKISNNSNQINNNNDIIKLNNLENKIQLIEDKIQNLGKVNITDNTNNKVNNNVKIESNNKRESFNNIDKFKDIIVSMGKLKLFSSLAGAKIYTNQNNIEIITDNEFAYKILIASEQKDCLEQIFKNNFNLNNEVIIKFEKKKNINILEKHLNENSINYTNMD